MFVPEEQVSSSFEPFLLDQNNADFFSGKTRSLKNERSNVVALVMMGLMTLVFIAITVSQLFVQVGRIQLQQSGAKADATVTLGESYDTRYSTDYYLTYQFKLTDGKDYTARQGVTGDLYSLYSEGSQISIIYSPTDPNTSQIDMDYTSADSWFDSEVPIVAIFCLVLVYITLRLVWQTLRDHDLARHGRIIKGEVVTTRSAAHRRKSGREYLSLTVNYKFQSPSGADLTNKREMVRYDLREKDLPQPGTPVAVLYATDTHYKVL